MGVSCQCSYQDAQCYKGKELLMRVCRLYERLRDPDHVRVALPVRDAWWQEYEQARNAYLTHVEENGMEARK